MKCSRINPKYTNSNFWQRFDKKMRETRQADRDAQKPTTTIVKSKKEEDPEDNIVMCIIKGIVEAVAAFILIWS